MARAKKPADVAPVEISPRAPDEVLAQLIAAGVNTNDCILELNGFLTTPFDMNLTGVWALPSRLFAFPIAVTKFDGVTQRRLSLMHPGVKDHPFVQKVEAALGVSLEYEPGCKNGAGWHAADLMSGEHWRDLMATRHLTNDEAMVRSLCFAVRYSDTGITPKLAKEILSLIPVTLPSNGLELLCEFLAPSAMTDEDKATSWPVNTGVMDSLEQIAAMLAGLERGWLKHDRSGYLQWTPLGVERFAAGHDAVVVETTGGQFALAF